MNYYSNPFLDKTTQQKIAKLRSIVAGIDKQCVQEETIQISTNLKIKYNELLNNRQLQAITHINGTLLVLAGSGTGKTSTLVYRVVFLLENGVMPENILLLTFTRNAAAEMLSRVDNLLGSYYSTSKISGGTFHSLANKIIRDHPSVFGIKNNFTILDASDSADTIEFVRKAIDINNLTSELPDKSLLQRIISLSKNSLTPIEDIICGKFQFLSRHKSYISQVYTLYEEHKTMYEQLDFDDLLLVLFKKLKENHGFKSHLQDQYKYIMVDEYQDTNVLQDGIVTELSDRSHNLMVVGDDSQSIYSFRGANIENILLFPEKHPGCKIIKLEENYRSHSNILNFANAITDQFQIGYKKRLFSSVYKEWLPRVMTVCNDKQEAIQIMEIINCIRNNEGDNFKLNQIAILFRDTYHSNFLQMYLNNACIRYNLYGGIRFNEKKHIKDIICHLRIIFNPEDAVAWTRVLKLIPGIGARTADKIISILADNDYKFNPDLFIKHSYHNALVFLFQIFQKDIFDKYNFHGTLGRICNYYQTLIRVIDDDYETREQDIKTLLSISKNYSDISNFLADFSLNPISETNDNKSDALVLSTIHSAKGLEWKYVFILRMNEGYFPSTKAYDSFDRLEEEKRLFYVAATRAKDQLIMFVSVFDSYSHRLRPIISRFIGNLPKSVYNLEYDCNLSRRILKLEG